ncbi:MAG TPA: dihydrofolate reductase family protein [Candidatus Limnocylindrales bacterium]|nr:dihydrofolate reductase family protein [Candidatus Limnocylindrales bacterium]
MTKIISSLTTSVDGYFVGPNDGPGKGLGEGGEALHTWVFGHPWTYESGPKGEPTGVDKAWMDAMNDRIGAVIAGRGTYEAADHWGGSNPWTVPLFIVTHRPEDEPADGGFQFVGSLDEAIERARSAAGDRDVSLMGGGETIRQGLRGGQVDELTIILAPITLGAGKRLFDGFDERIELEHLGVRQSPFATFVDYRVKR